MKKRFLTCTFLFFILNVNAIGVCHPTDVSDSNYVVIGAFAIQNNATHFVEDAKKLNLKAEFAINPVRKLYYVYVLHTENAPEAIAMALRLRTETPYDDTWVYNGLLGENNDGRSGTDPVTEQKLSKVNSDDTSQVAKAVNVISEPAGTETNSIAGQSATAENQSTAANPSQNVVPVGVDIKKNEAVISEMGKGFYFKIVSATGEEIKGEVDLIDAERLSKIKSYDGNTQVFIKPVNKTGKIELICEVFGYRKLQKELNYNLPDSTAGVVIENGNTVVPFELIRLFKGDIAVMYNVFFFKDAAVMRPESQYEVASLRDMMKENPSYKIKLHGHTNGNSSGKIITRGESKNFFSLSGTKDGFGSAKELSEERAEAIRSFLISEGINEERIMVKAWGGKKPIQEKESSKAHENIRVEVEILED